MKRAVTQTSQSLRIKDGLMSKVNSMKSQGSLLLQSAQRFLCHYEGIKELPNESFNQLTTASYETFINV